MENKKTYKYHKIIFYFIALFLWLFAGGMSHMARVDMTHSQQMSLAIFIVITVLAATELLSKGGVMAASKGCILHQKN